MNSEALEIAENLLKMLKEQDGRLRKVVAILDGENPQKDQVVINARDLFRKQP